MKNLFCPVSVFSKEVIDWACENELLDQPDEIPNLTCDMDIANALNVSIKKNNSFPCIRDEFYEGEKIREKINSLIPVFELRGNAIWLKIECHIRQELEADELESLKAYAAKQADAWGLHGIQAYYAPYELIFACLNVANWYPCTKTVDLYENCNLFYENEIKNA